MKYFTEEAFNEMAIGSLIFMQNKNQQTNGFKQQHQR